MRHGTSVGAALLVLWLLIGAVAAAQRGYFERDATDCPTLGTTLISIVAGPLNYMGVNPTMSCDLPEPSR